MKKLLQHFTLVLFILAALQTENGFAQAASWQWARGAGSTGVDQAISTVVDANGNVYTIGWYTSASITFGSITLTNAGAASSDIFVTKQDAAGNVLWAKSFGGANGDIGNSIAVDASGEVYITGWYASSTIVFGSSTLTNVGMGSDIFVVKLNATGNAVWAKNEGGSNSDRGNSIAVDASGNVFTTGGFMSATANFGTVTVTNAASGVNDVFVAKHDPSGNVLWAKSAGGSGSEMGLGVDTDPSGNSYVTGSFASPSMNFGTGALTNASSGTQDIFVVKYDASGTAVWAKQVGGSADDFGNALVVSGNGLCITGGFNSASINFSTTALNNVSAGTSDVFFTKYDLDGNLVWAIRAGNTDSEAGNGVDVDALGNFFIAGYFNSASLTFGSTTLNNVSSGYKDLFIAACDATGAPLWATSAGDAAEEIANSISVNAAGTEVHIAGVFNSGSLIFAPFMIYKGCGDDVFISKLIAPVVSVKESFIENSLLIYPNPAHDQLRVNAIGRICLYNLLGKLVLSIDHTDTFQPAIIDVSSLPKGVYFCETAYGQNRTTKDRIVIK